MDMIDYDEQSSSFDAVANLIEQARTIAICAHTAPDGDALGSGLALAEVIRTTWPGREVVNLLADEADVPRIYRFLPGVDAMVCPSECTISPDLFICVDLSGKSRLADAQAVLERSVHVAVLDHHPGTEHFWDAGLVRPDAAAAGCIVCEFALHVGCDLSATIAQNLLCAIMTDTGRFQYQNADAEAFECASMLVEAGASPSEIALRVYQSDRLNYMHLEATVMARVRTFAGGKIAYSYATTADIESAHVTIDECEGLVDVVRRVDGAEIAMFLKQVPGGKVRGNLRSKTGHDVAQVARSVGGGGHVAAAGFTYEGDIDETFAAVMPGLRALVEAPAEAEGTERS